jgi:hypothetical protein
MGAPPQSSIQHIAGGVRVWAVNQAVQRLAEELGMTLALQHFRQLSEVLPCRRGDRGFLLLARLGHELDRDFAVQRASRRCVIFWVGAVSAHPNAKHFR